LFTGFIIGYILYFFINGPKPNRKYKKSIKTIDKKENLLEKQN